MTCPDCADSGYRLQDIGTATIPDHVEFRCGCNPKPTDADIPDWIDDLIHSTEPMGTAAEDFRPAFNDAQYEGI